MLKETKISKKEVKYLTESECNQIIDSLLGDNKINGLREELMNHYLDLILAGKLSEVPYLKKDDYKNNSNIFLTEVDLVENFDQLFDIISKNTIVGISATDVIGKTDKFIKLYEIKQLLDGCEFPLGEVKESYNYLDGETHCAVLTLIKKEAS